MNLLGKYTLFAEGARGSLTKQLAQKFKLARRPRLPEVRHRPEGAVGAAAGASTSAAL